MSSQVKEQIKNLQAAQTGGSFGVDRPAVSTEPLVVMPAHYTWMQRPDKDRKYNAKALEHARKVFAGEDYVPRAKGEMRFTPSSLAERCGRRALFSYAGAKKSPDEVRSLDLMEVGNLWHLMLQMEGLTAGWLDDVECTAQITYKGKTVFSKIDGIGALGIFELKTKGSWIFSDILQVAQWEHLMQFEAYCLVFGIDIGSLVYVNRDNGAMKEHRLRADEVRRRQLLMVLDDLIDRFVDVDDLPEMLAECRSRDSAVYRRCPYRGICPDAGRLSTVGDLRG